MRGSSSPENTLAASGSDLTRKIWEKEGEILILNKLIDGSSPGLGVQPLPETLRLQFWLELTPWGFWGAFHWGKAAQNVIALIFPRGKFLVEVKKQWAVHKPEWKMKFSGILPLSCHLYQNDFVLCLWIDVRSLVIFVMPSLKSRFWQRFSAAAAEGESFCSAHFGSFSDSVSSPSSWPFI